MTTAVSPSAPLGNESIITGEAIELEVRPASVPLRALAGIIDAGLWVATGIFAMLMYTRFGPVLNPAQAQTLLILGVAALTFGIPFLIEWLTGGRSLGKTVVGIRVLREDGGPVRLRHVFVRALVGVVENWATFGALATVVSLANARGRRLGDLLAGTYCVRMRDVESDPYPLVLPPELTEWVRTADIAPIPSNLSNRARIFLTRSATMSPQARQTHAESLAAELESFVSPPPPAGTHPERFMAAVLVRRRNEEYLSLLRQREAIR